MDVLSELRDWVDAEYRFALEHRTAARQCEDYRAGERHDSYGMAMAKVLHRIADVSRQQEIPHRSEVAKDS